MLFACGEAGPAQEGRPEFRTTPPSLLYFKNMRSAYYEMAEQAGTRIEKYRLRKYAESDQRPILYATIANNWMQDEAYLLLEPNAFLRRAPAPLEVLWRSADSTGVLTPDRPGLPHQYGFARELADRLQAGRELFIIDDRRDTVPLFADFGDRTHFLTTLRDYEKLTERR